MDKTENLIKNSKNLKFLFYEKPKYFLAPLKEPRDFNVFYKIMNIVYNVPLDTEKLNLTELNCKYDEYIIMFKTFNFDITNILGHHIFKDFCNTNTNINYYLSRCYNIEYAKLLLKKRQSIFTLERFIEKYGDELGKKKFNDTISKSINTLRNNPNYNDICNSRGKSKRVSYHLTQINPVTNDLYTYEEAHKKLHTLQSDSSKKRWEYYRNGLSKYVPNTSLEFYLNKGMSLDEAIISLNKRQNLTSLKSFIERYGEHNGIIKYNKRIERFKQTFKNKSDEELANIRIKQRSRLKFASTAATMFFKNIITKLKNDGIIFKEVYYGEKEFFIYDNHKKRIFFYDFVINDINYACEFNGHKFHADPRISIEERNTWKSVYSNKSWQQCYEFDNYKNSLILENGFILDIVWDFEEINYKTNLIINNIKNKWITQKNLS